MYYYFCTKFLHAIPQILDDINISEGTVTYPNFGHPAQTWSFTKYCKGHFFATIANGLSVLKLFQLSNGNYFSQHFYNICKARKPGNTEFRLGVRSQGTLPYSLNFSPMLQRTLTRLHYPGEYQILYYYIGLHRIPANRSDFRYPAKENRIFSRIAKKAGYPACLYSRATVFFMGPDILYSKDTVDLNANTNLLSFRNL